MIRVAYRWLPMVTDGAQEWLVNDRKLHVFGMKLPSGFQLIGQVVCTPLDANASTPTLIVSMRGRRCSDARGCVFISPSGPPRLHQVADTLLHQEAGQPRPAHREPLLRQVRTHLAEVVMSGPAEVKGHSCVASEWD